MDEYHDVFPSPCIEGEGAQTAKGYHFRAFTVGRGKQYSIYQHRMSFEQNWGVTIPPGTLVRHTCDNSGCMNPLHLQLGTHTDNRHDRILREGRTNA